MSALRLGHLPLPAVVTSGCGLGLARLHPNVRIRGYIPLPLSASGLVAFTDLGGLMLPGVVLLYGRIRHGLLCEAVLSCFPLYTVRKRYYGFHVTGVTYDGIHVFLLT